MTVNAPLVSVIILTYNQDSFVSKAIQCVLNQKTSFSFEIIIGDDFSTDETRKVIDGFKNDFQNQISLYYPLKNHGLLSNYSNCIKLCKGKFLTVCAGDDYWHNPLKLQKQIDFLLQNSEFGMVHSDADFLYNSSGRVIKSYRKTTNFNIKSGFIFEQLLLDNFIIAPTTCVQIDLIRKYVDFDEYEKLGFMMEDYPMWLELSNHTKIGYLDESFATYRIHNKSIRNTEKAAKHLLFLNTTYRIKNHFITKFGCTAEIQKKVNERFHRKELFYGTVLKDSSLTKSAYAWLKSEFVKISWIEYLYYWCTRERLLRGISSILLKKFHSLN
jgi:glycosyltransferase involved in cell wall biosynthesis